MTLRQKTFAIIIVPFAALILVFSTISYKILLNNYVLLEEQDIHEQVERSLSGLATIKKRMLATLRDWAPWDETYDFIVDANSKYIEDNLADATLVNLRLNVMIFVNIDHQVVHAKKVDLQTKSAVPFTRDQMERIISSDSLFQPVQSNDSCHGIIMLDQPMLVVSHPILTSDKQGPHRGTLIMGYYLNANAIADLASMMHLSLTSYPVNAPDIPADVTSSLPLLVADPSIQVMPLDGNTIAGYALINDLFDRPALVFRVTNPRSIYKSGVISNRYLIMSLLSVSMIVGGLVILLIEKQVLARLSRLGNSILAIKHSQDLTARVNCEGHDELYHLAEEVNKLLASIETSERSLRDHHNLLKVVIEGTKDLIYVTDIRGRVLLINSAAAGMIGKDIDAITGQKLTALMPRERAGQFTATDDLVMRTKLPQVYEENLISFGKTVSYLNSKSPMLDGNGEIIGIILIARDITEFKRVEAELFKVKKLESLGIMAGGVAHDFNNILMVITGFLALAKINAGNNVKLVDTIVNAQNAAQRAKDLTQQLIAFARGGAPVKQTLSVSKLISDNVEFFHQGYKSKCVVNIPDDMIAIAADPNQIGQVFQNLFINADQSMPNGGVITIDVEKITINESIPVILERGNYIKISVSDQGVGIPAEKLPQVFDPFFTTKRTGTGLGLSITHTIIRNHGGHIDVASTLNVGTTFHLYLPAQS